MAIDERAPVIVVHVITGLNNGGAEGALFRLVTADSPHRHHVVSMIDGGVYGERLARAGIPVHVLNMPRGRVTGGGVRSLYRILTTIRPDVVQTWMYHADLLAGIVAGFAGCRTVVWGVRASDAHDQAAGPLARFVVRCGAWCSRVVPTRIIFNSQAGARVHYRAGYDAGRSTVIGNGFDVERLAPDPAIRARQRHQWQMPPAQRVLGTVARWDLTKDHATLADALSRMTADPSWTAVWIGPGMTSDNADLAALLRRHGLIARVRLHGATPDPSGVMNGADLHVLSSCTEAFPNVLAEAMACGTPCVTTDVGDARHIVGDTGWVVPSRNAGALATAMTMALAAHDDRAAWRERQGRCRARIETEFSLQAMVARYDEVWRQAVAPPNH